MSDLKTPMRQDYLLYKEAMRRKRAENKKQRADKKKAKKRDTHNLLLKTLKTADECEATTSTVGNETTP